MYEAIGNGGVSFMPEGWTVLKIKRKSLFSNRSLTMFTDKFMMDVVIEIIEMIPKTGHFRWRHRIQQWPFEHPPK